MNSSNPQSPPIVPRLPFSSLIPPPSASPLRLPLAMPTSGRYQSRFFSFLSEQSLRLRDKTSQTWRQVKLATAWGVQVVLYPVYLAFQTTRLVNRQLQQTVRRVLPLLQAVNQPLQEPSTQGTVNQPVLTSDAPIRKVLEAIAPIVQSLSPTQVIGQLPSAGTAAGTGSVVTGAMQTSPAAFPPIQSIASQLDTHALVLVTHENQILDILSSDQQLHLQRRLVWEMSNYWQAHRKFAGSPGMTNFLPLPSDRPNALLPIRIFYRLMAWMQTSPIAVATNLFQESRLAVLHAYETTARAALPASELASQPQLRSAEVPWLSLQEALSGVFDRPSAPSSSPSPTLRSRLREWWQADKAELVHLPENKTPSPPPPQTPPLTPSQPWLTWEDLFGKRPLSSKPSSDWELFEPPPNQKLVKRTASAVKRAASPARSISAQPEPEVALPIVFETEEAAGLAPVESQSQAEEIVLSPTWIEAEVKLVTYVKHPLEQVLEWLDRGMLWVEEKIANAINWLRDRLGSGKDNV